jgi:hypothetical protein
MKGIWWLVEGFPRALSLAKSNCVLSILVVTTITPPRADRICPRELGCMCVAARDMQFGQVTSSRSRLTLSNLRS